MRTVYIYLSVAGWIWFVIAGSYLIFKFRFRLSGKNPRGFDVILPGQRIDSVSTEAKQPNE